MDIEIDIDIKVNIYRYGYTERYREVDIQTHTEGDKREIIKKYIFLSQGCSIFIVMTMTTAL